jgi:hypothetical protein
VALTDPIDTLAFHQSRVLCQHRDMSTTPVGGMTSSTKSFMQADTNPSTLPELEALWFYGMNHGMALISARYAPYEPLPPNILKFVDDYHSMLVPKAVRAAHYLLLICTREFRHNKSLSTDLPLIKSQFGAKTAEFFGSAGSGEQGIHNSLIKSPPETTLGAYVQALRWGFYNSKWSGGYGGKAWGQVTDCLCNFVNGTFTAEMMLDTVWTLCHNNGPIFNKGQLYGMYTSRLVKILDVQRSGQIPEAVIEGGFAKEFANQDPNLLMQMRFLKKTFPDQVGDYVDWFLVESLGAVHTYPDEKAAQEAKYGLSAKALEAAKNAAALEEKKLAALKAKKAKLVAEAAEQKLAAAKAKAEYLKTHFHVHGNVYVSKINRNAA